MTTTPIRPFTPGPRAVVGESTQHVLRRVGAPAIAFVALTGIVWHHRGPVGIDTFLLHGYIARERTALFTVASMLTNLASPTAVAILGTLIAGYLWRYRHDARRALVCFSAPLMAGATEATLKIVVERLRPATGALTGEHGYGYPSGHTAGFAALAFAVALTADGHRGRAIGLALSSSVAIAITRVIVGAHYPTDVLGGLLLGGTIAAVSGMICALTNPLFTHHRVFPSRRGSVEGA